MYGENFGEKTKIIFHHNFCRFFPSSLSLRPDPLSPGMKKIYHIFSFSCYCSTPSPAPLPFFGFPLCFFAFSFASHFFFLYFFSCSLQVRSNVQHHSSPESLHLTQFSHSQKNALVSSRKVKIKSSALKIKSKLNWSDGIPAREDADTEKKKYIENQKTKKKRKINLENNHFQVGVICMQDSEQKNSLSSRARHVIHSQNVIEMKMIRRMRYVAYLWSAGRYRLEKINWFRIHFWRFYLFSEFHWRCHEIL